MSLLSRVPLIFFIACLLLAGFLLYTRPPQPSFASLDACFQSNIPDRSCIERNVRSLLDASYTSRDLMAHVIASSTPYTVTSYCHEAAHIIGTETFARAPNTETALSRCSSVCNYGCIHGVIAAAVADEMGEAYTVDDIAHADLNEIERIGARYCTKGLCHAVGHILYIGTQDIPRALQSCDRLNANESAESCYQGVFMEAAGGQEVFAATTTSRQDSNYSYPCDIVAAPYRHACFQYLPNFQRQLFARDAIPESAQFSLEQQTCETFSRKDRSDCFFGIGYIFLRTNERKDTADDPRRPALCETLRGSDQDSCVVGLALKNALSDKYVNGIQYCEHRSDTARIALCFNAIFQTMQHASFTDDAVLARCNDSDAAALCKLQYERYIGVAKSLPVYFQRGLF